jgi:signal transduction histidine kinase
VGAARAISVARIRGLAIATALVAGGATLLISLLPVVHVAYRSVSLHIAIETAAAVTAVLAAYLVFGRFKLSFALGDLELLAALTLLAGASLAFTTIPAVADAGSSTFATWAPLAGQLFGAGALAYAAPGRQRNVRPRHAAWTTLAVCAAALTTIALLVLLLAPHLPEAIDPRLSPDTSDRPRVTGNAVVLACQALAMVLFALAAVGFTRRAERSHDEFMGWLAIAATLGAVARLNYFLFPSLFSEWVYTGDILRLAMYGALLGGALHEIGAYQRRAAATAVLEERRRVARDLHDGLAQDLAYISGQSRRLDRLGVDGAMELAGAVDRAMTEARAAIAALTRATDEPLDVALAQAAEEVALRAGARVRLDLGNGVEVPAPAREGLARIVREAVTNAVRHGGATEVTVSLAANDALSLRIVDNGDGFEPAEHRRYGFGLESMRERAAALGGSLRLESRPGAGTRVEVLLP